MNFAYTWTRACAVTALLIAGMAVGHAENIPLSATFEEGQVVTTVVSVDAANHLVVLKGPDGREVTLQLGEDAKNLGQLKPGDTVKTVVTRSVATMLDTEVDKAPAKATEQNAEVRAAEGSPHPGGAAYRQVQVQLKIKHIDVEKNQVTFEGPAGAQKVIDVLDPKNQARLKDLKVDQSVWVTYTDTLEVTTQR